jgi:orotidine-5'-phosphate decarboxylase
VFEILAEMAVEWGAHGVIIGATRPEVITRVRELVGQGLAIYSPGVGAQGGDARKALDAGSTYIIVGRAIYNAPDPEKAAMEFRASISKPIILPYQRGSALIRPWSGLPMIWTNLSKGSKRD